MDGSLPFDQMHHYRNDFLFKIGLPHNWPQLLILY